MLCFTQTTVKRLCQQLLCLSCLILTCYANYGRLEAPHRKVYPTCVPIQEKACKGFNYNATTIPNIFGHESQREASSRFQEFAPLVDSQCSDHIRFFICTLHFPMCDPKVNVAIPACRLMCEEVRSKCAPLMKVFEKEWSIDCSQLPEYGEVDRLCMQPPNMTPSVSNTEEDLRVVINPNIERIVESAVRESEITSSKNVKMYPGIPNQDAKPDSNENRLDFYDENEETYIEYKNNVYINVKTLSEGSDQGAKDPGKEVMDVVTITVPKCPNPNKFHWIKKNDLFGECVPRCDVNLDVLFSSRDKGIAYCLLTVFAFLCFASTATSVCTFAIDSKRFRYPERPIIFLSFCYCIYSVAYLVRSSGGPTASLGCMASRLSEDDEEIVHHLVKGGLEGSGCTAVFFILYYFGMAASAWWVVLTLTWLLSAGFKWGHEAIEAYSFHFHVVAWVLPAAQTIAVLILAKVDGDELTGICYVGNLEPDSLMYFVIIPLTFYLLSGTVAVILGFGYLFKIRRVIKHQQSDKAAVKLEKLMIKIGLFSVLYIVPVTCVVAINFYQYRNYATWIQKAQISTCDDPSFLPNTYQDPFESLSGHFKSQYDGGRRHDEAVSSRHSKRSLAVAHRGTGSLLGDRNHAAKLDCHLDESIPSLPFFAIKIFMSLVAGITSGMWVWSTKTVESWKQTFQILRRCATVTHQQNTQNQSKNSQNYDIEESPGNGSQRLYKVAHEDTNTSPQHYACHHKISSGYQVPYLENYKSHLARHSQNGIPLITAKIPSQAYHEMVMCWQPLSQTMNVSNQQSVSSRNCWNVIPSHSTRMKLGLENELLSTSNSNDSGSGAPHNKQLCSREPYQMGSNSRSDGLDLSTNLSNPYWINSTLPYSKRQPLPASATKVLESV